MQTNSTSNNMTMTDFELENGIFNYLFYFIIEYTCLTSTITSVPRMSHLWSRNDKLAQRILDPTTFDYLLAIENTQRTKPSWQRMSKLTN